MAWTRSSERVAAVTRSLDCGVIKGRGASSNVQGRYEADAREPFDDGWAGDREPPPALRTDVQMDRSRTVISWNESPDVPFDRSINPYRGCEHGCIYCYARPTHAWLGLSPGLDFERRLFYKPDAGAQLRAALGKRGYRCAPIGLGANTDPYQPVEKRLGITRAILEVLNECAHPVQIVTKSGMVERDLDLLAPMAERNLCSVSISVTTLDAKLARRLEPRANAPARRIEAIRRLSRRGIPVAVFAAPMIPVLNDAELESILEAAAQAGATSAWYSVLRLPLELKSLFTEWLREHEPLKADHVMQRIRDLRGGREYDSDFSQRMHGRGQYADLLAHRFRLCAKRLGFGPTPALDASQFRPPAADSAQLGLFTS